MVVEDDTESKQKLVGECEGFVKDELEELLVKYEGLFSEKPGNTAVVEMSINTEGNHSVPIGIRNKVKSELDALEDAGVIERSDSPWASPLVPVRKPDGAVRLCIDFRRLNANTVVEPYYIPGLVEITTKVGRSVKGVVKT